MFVFAFCCVCYKVVGLLATESHQNNNYLCCWLVMSFFFFSFAYTTSPAAAMKLVVFFRSSRPPYSFWWCGVADGHCAIRSGWCLLHLWRTCSLSGPPHHRDTLGKERFLVSCARVRWACCGRNAVVPKPPSRACQEGGMHPSPFWVSALFDDGGLFLVIDAGWWLLFLCSAFG